jgi:hypothetical protein
MPHELMIEKVARAIASANGDANWRAHLPAARAAVSSLIEPTDEMLAAAMPACADWGYLPEDWRAMINYILHESAVLHQNKDAA